MGTGKTVSVIVSKCTPDGQRISERISEEKFPSIVVAKSIGNSKLASGVCVIVRPNYNEPDESGRWFREWRSMNGEPFKEVVFDKL